MSKLIGKASLGSGDFAREKIQHGEIDLKEVKVNFKKNVRTDYNELEELARSIKKDGQLQPIGLDDKDNLIYGFRRYKAIKEILKLKKIKFVRVSFENLEEIQLVENIQREDLSDYEIAKSLSKLKKKDNATNKDLSLRLNKTEKWIEDKIKHNDLIKETLSHVDVGKIAELEDIPTSLVNETRKLNPKERAKVLTSGKSQKKIREDVKTLSHVDVGKPEKMTKKPLTKKEIELQIIEIDFQIEALKEKKKELRKQITELGIKK
jgi:ParB family chromosome partitioning protein